MEKKLIVALAAMVEIVNRRAVDMTPEEVSAAFAAIELLAEAQAKCDDCVDY
jgi:hypothetical protein